MKRTAPLSHNHQKVANELLGKTGVLENRYCGPDPTLSRSFKGHEDAISAIDFDPKMRSVASASLDSIVNVWNFKPQQRPFKFVAHKGPVYCLKFSPDGETVASGGADRMIRLWTNSVQGKYESLKSHLGNVRGLSFSLNGQYLLSSSDDKTSKLWRVGDKKFMYSLAAHKHWVRSGEISPDMRLIATGSDDKSVKLWDFQNQAIVNSYSEHDDVVSKVLFHPDGTCVISSSFDKKIKIIDVRSNKLVQHYNAHDAPVNDISIHPTGYFLASVAGDAKVKIWDLRQGRQIYTLYSNDKEVTAVAFSPQGDYFATGGSQNLCMVWKTNFDFNVKEIDQIHKSAIYYTAGGLNSTTQFKSNKVENYQPNATRTRQIPLENEQQYNMEVNDDLYNRQTSSPTFSQQYTENVPPCNFQQNKTLKQFKVNLNEGQAITSVPFHPSSYKNQQADQNVQRAQATQCTSQPAQIFVPPPKQVGFASTTAFLQTVPEENLISETLAASLQHIYQRIDSMVQVMHNIDNRISKQEQTTHGGETELKEHQINISHQPLPPHGGLSVKFDNTLHSIQENEAEKAPLNIFQTGALINTDSIEASLIAKSNS